MSEKILFVDDDANILHSFKRNLRKRFQIDTALGGEDGLRILAERGPFAVVISDMRMPGMDGTKFLSHVFETSPDTVRILLTGQADMNDAIAVVNEGQIFRFLTKPCPTEKLVPAIEQGLRQYRLITAEKELLSKTLKGTIKLLIDILSVVNPDAFSRAKRIHKTARKIAARLKFKDQWQLDIACMLSQVGCVTVPGEILQKKFRGEKLSPSENNIFFQHVQVGKDLVENIPRLEVVARAIEYQEKCFDGSGWPRNSLKGKNIPFISRILKVALDYDTFSASGMNNEEIKKIMQQNDFCYDPDILAALYAEMLQAEGGYVVREIKAAEIDEGMILLDGIKTKLGTLLIPKGYEISKVLKMRILNFTRTTGIEEPIKVMERVVEVR